MGRMVEERSLVARRIEEIRLAKKKSRQEIADLLGITYLQVYRIERGKVRITDQTAADFAAALDVSVASLYRESKAAS